MKDAYYEYKDRFDLEHYFRSIRSKSKLLMDKCQSSDPKKDDDFMLWFGAISYHILCLVSADLLDDIQIRHLGKYRSKMSVKSTI